MSTILEVSNLTKNYDNVQALKGITTQKPNFTGFASFFSSDFFDKVDCSIIST